MRALLTAAGIVLGVGMIFGVLTLSGTISRTFTDLFDSVYGRADLVVSGSESTSLPKRTLSQVRSTPGVEEAQGNVFSVFTKYEAPPPRLSRRRCPEGLPPGTPPPEPPPPPKPPKPDPADQLNVVGEEPGVSDLTDTDADLGPAPAARARDHGRGELGGRPGGQGRRPAPAGHPVGNAPLRGHRPVPVLDRRRLRRPGLRDDADRPRPRGDGQGAAGSTRSTSSSRAATRDRGVRKRASRQAREGRPDRDPGREVGRGRVAAPGVQRDPLLLRRDGPLRRGLPDLQRLQHDRAPAHAGARHAAHARRDQADGRPRRPARGARARASSAASSGSASASCSRSASSS